MNTVRNSVPRLVASLIAIGVLALPVAGLAHGPGMGMADEGYYGYGAQQGYGPGMGMMGPGMGMMGQGMGYGPGMGFGMMDLTDDQRDKLFQVHSRVRKEQYKRMGEMMEVMEALRAEMLKPEPKPEAVAKAYDRVSAVQREMLKARVAAQNEMSGMLTPEQREQWRGMRGMMW